MAFGSIRPRAPIGAVPQGAPPQVWDERVPARPNPFPAPRGPLDEAIDLPTTPMSPAPDASTLDLSSASVRHPGFFQEGGTGRDIAALLAQAITGQPFYSGPRQLARQQAHEQMLFGRQDAQRQQDRGWQVEDREARINAPQFFMSGRDRVRYDPASDNASVVYDGPEDYQNYAGALGLDPGQDGYDDAVRDFTLRGNGPTALAGRRALEQQRQQDRLLVRASPTYANTHARPRASGGDGSSGPPRSTSAVIAPILLKMAQGQPLTPAEQAALNYSRPGRAGGGRGTPGGGGAAPAMPTVRSPSEARALPPGTQFRTPDGKVKVR